MKNPKNKGRCRRCKLSRYKTAYLDDNDNFIPESNLFCDVYSSYVFMVGSNCKAPINGYKSRDHYFKTKYKIK